MPFKLFKVAVYIVLLSKMTTKALSSCKRYCC